MVSWQDLYSRLQLPACAAGSHTQIASSSSGNHSTKQIARLPPPPATAGSTTMQSQAGPRPCCSLGLCASTPCHMARRVLLHYTLLAPRHNSSTFMTLLRALLCILLLTGVRCLQRLHTQVWAQPTPTRLVPSRMVTK